MKLLKLIFFLAFLTLLSRTDVLAQNEIKNTPNKSSKARTGDKGWKLIFSDEFNQTGDFDTTKWAYSPRWSPAWAKYLTASKEYVQVEGKRLVLRMDDKKVAGDDVPYHSGGIQTSGKFSFTYGKVEVRAKFNKGKGSWPAIWLMPEPPHAYGNWPNSGEIDVMEHVNHEPVVHQTIHNALVTGQDGGSTAAHSSAYDENDFNTYGIVWKPDSIQFFINGILKYTYAKPVNATSRQWPFDKPFYLILNQSGGAGWPGAITNTELPFVMEVDWVRVYQ